MITTDQPTTAPDHQPRPPAELYCQAPSCNSPAGPPPVSVYLTKTTLINERKLYTTLLFLHRIHLDLHPAFSEHGLR
jgi:hypothetical protein